MDFAHVFDSLTEQSAQAESTRLPDCRQSAALLRRDARQRAARVQRLEALQSLIGTVQPGDCWHIMTSGELDAGNILDYLVQHHGPFGKLLLSTWSMERKHIQMLGEHLERGAFNGFDALTGDFFAQRLPANYTALCNLAGQHRGRVYRLNNHSKILAMANDRIALVVEGSANFTKNPRVENACITADRGLYDHVADWFANLTDNRDEYRIPS